MVVVRGYEQKLDHNVKCVGCQRNFGPQSEFRIGYLVKDGEVVGLFHSRQCYENTVQKFEEYKKEKGGGE